MKKFFSLFLIIISLFCSVAYATNESPTRENYISCEPAIEYVTVDNPCRPDAAILIDVNQEYGEVVWNFIFKYNAENEFVFAALVNSEGQATVLNGDIQKDGQVMFDFTEVEPNIYYMVVFSGEF